MKQPPPNRASWAATLRANADRANVARGAATAQSRARDRSTSSAAVVISVIRSASRSRWPAARRSTPGLHAECTPAQVDGLTCNGTVLGIVTVVLTSVAILGFVIAAGMVIVNIIRGDGRSGGRSAPSSS